MQIVLQRVQRAAVHVVDAPGTPPEQGRVTGQIGPGLVALVGVGHRSTDDDARWLAAKTAGLRVFADEQGRMNRALADIDGGVLAISQFTLYGDVSRGRRPSFVGAAEPQQGSRLYDVYCDALVWDAGVPVGRGEFGAMMVVDFLADGPVTLLLRREGGTADG
ncbi:MAG: D-aminoacyl-tRNA deacylase [Egibacteraceae bacterium]